MYNYHMHTRIALAILPHFWPNSPPLGLAYLKGFLKANDIEVDCLDINISVFSSASIGVKRQWQNSCNREFEAQILSLFKKHHQGEFQNIIDKLLDYEIICFSCFKSNFPATKGISMFLKRLKPSLKIVLGGPEIANFYFRAKSNILEEFSHFADFLVVGEGEIPLLEYLQNPPPYHVLAVYKEQRILEEGIVPDFSDFDLASYKKKGVIPLILSRGCIKRCRFCTERLLYKRFRVYPINSIIEQINMFNKQDINTFVFNDSLINGDLVWLDQLCDAIIDKTGAIKWEAQMAIRNDMPDNLFEKIKKSGCYHLLVGLESGCANTLKGMNKGYTPDDAKVFFEKLNRAGLSFGVSMIFGFPNETECDYLKSVNFILENRALIPKIEQVNPFICYDGVPFDKRTDYKNNPESIKRAKLFIEKIKREKIKHTNAFLLNLTDWTWR